MHSLPVKWQVAFVWVNFFFLWSFTTHQFWAFFLETMRFKQSSPPSISKVHFTPQKVLVKRKPKTAQIKSNTWGRERKREREKERESKMRRRKESFLVHVTQAAAVTFGIYITKRKKNFSFSYFLSLRTWVFLKMYKYIRKLWYNV